MKRVILLIAYLIFLVAGLFAQSAIQPLNSATEVESKSTTIGTVVLGMMTLTFAATIVFAVYVFIMYRKSNKQNNS
jgi:heme/copper-type cytochrome/quinol oxidase subunit 2